jgi:nicotinamide-nucleotide amidase
MREYEFKTAFKGFFMSSTIIPTDEVLHELAEQLGDRLQRANSMLACAESCTGGFVSKVITDIAGSSAWFERGFVTYTNQAKQELLGVPAETIVEHGAVSEHTARAMAAGALRHSAASIALAITGIAGPGGGSLDKPVGLVWFAWTTRDGVVESDSCQFSGNRDMVRRQSVEHALLGVLKRVG